MSLIKNFWKKLFGRQQSIPIPIPYSPREYTGPKEFANQPAVDYLIKHVKYQALPELSGRAIPFKSLFTIEEDIQKALKNEYPDLGSITICENLRPTWHGSLVSPKYIHFSEQRMQVDFHTVNAECNAITLEDLEYLCFLDQRTDEWLHNEDYTTEVFTLDALSHQLEASSDQVYLHMIIDNGKPWNEYKPVNRKLRQAVTDRVKALSTNKSADYNPLWQAIVEVYNDKFFPAELIIREACLTNWLRDGQSCVYSHRYFYF